MFPIETRDLSGPLSSKEEGRDLDDDDEDDADDGGDGHFEAHEGLLHVDVDVDVDVEVRIADDRCQLSIRFLDRRQLLSVLR